MSFWRAGPDGVTVMVKVRPRSGRPGIQGTRESGSGERLRIEVAEITEDGKANDAVRAMLAGALDRPVSSVRIVAGATRREKLLAVEGDATALVERLKAL
jgi:uncharacterized protein YggU (UPF0235/DUF167 family)